MTIIITIYNCWYITIVAIIREKDEKIIIKEVSYQRLWYTCTHFISSRGLYHFVKK